MAAIRTCYTSAACNRCPNIADWGNNGLICFGYHNAVSLYETEDLVEGLEEFGRFGTTKMASNSALVFMRHIVLKNFSKLRVNFTVLILRHCVAAGFATMVNFSSLPPEAMATAHSAERSDQLFNCFNSKALHSKQVMGHAISVNWEHLRFLNETPKWLNTVRANNLSGSLPCLERLYLLTDRLNQDCLENLLSVIKGKGGHRFNPSPQEFRAALRQTMVNAVLV
ncbi:transposable element p transposase [Plakobranchus ocellatus]|uniref:Transposable element p transposase n=1 Tax=Plakobranchus ocellatus TaxID=259542 RepID=A0AAV3XYW0_9GAST|nr:transposable element p transposase [Plakobranchus ocellatus]